MNSISENEAALIRNIVGRISKLRETTFRSPKMLAVIDQWIAALEEGLLPSRTRQVNEVLNIITQSTNMALITCIVHDCPDTENHKFLAHVLLSIQDACHEESRRLEAKLLLEMASHNPSQEDKDLLSLLESVFGKQF